MTYSTRDIKSVLNTLVRLGTLVAKLALALYMGRYLSLQDLGRFGLVFAAVMILTSTLGFRLDFIVSRELVRVEPAVALVKMRDQTVFYLLNYAAAIVLLIILNIFVSDSKTLFFVGTLTIANSYGDVTYFNMNSTEKPLLANALYFIAGGLWCFVPIILGILWPEFRNVETIFIAWLAGYLTFIAAAFWAWRKLPWSELSRRVNWIWVKNGVRKTFFIWVGTCCIMAGAYIDRFVLGQLLGLEKVGIATFYLSFVNAMIALVQSGLLAVMWPRLVANYREGDYKAFWKEMRLAFGRVALFSGFMAISIAVSVPLLGSFLQRPELIDNAPVLWLLVVAAFIRCNGETIERGLFAMQLDRAIWLGNTLYLIPVLIGNIVLIAVFGFYGLGYSAVISSLCLFAWRGWQMRASA